MLVECGIKCAIRSIIDFYRKFDETICCALINQNTCSSYSTINVRADRLIQCGDSYTTYGLFRSQRDGYTVVCLCKRWLCIVAVYGQVYQRWINCIYYDVFLSNIILCYAEYVSSFIICGNVKL